MKALRIQAQKWTDALEGIKGEVADQAGRRKDGTDEFQGLEELVGALEDAIDRAAVLA